MAVRDYSLLAEQPLSANQLHDQQRSAIVISAVVDDAGVRHVLSRYADAVWELWPFFDQANIQAARKRIEWNRMPSQFREACKAVLYRYWMVGMKGGTRPTANTLARMASSLLRLLNYLDKHGVGSMLEVHPLHITNFVHELRTTGGMGPSGIHRQCGCVELLYRFRNEHPEGLTFHPWPEDSTSSVAGIGPSSNSAGKTPLIPREVVATLYRFAEDILENADTILDQRDKGPRYSSRQTRASSCGAS